MGRVRLQVSDRGRSVTFYHDVLGLRVLAADTAAATLGAGATPLVELHHRPGVRAVPHGAILGLYHFAILLPSRADLGRFARHLDARGHPFASADHLVSEAIYLWDPDGLGIEVYADRPRDTWQVRGQELVMATEPLDRRSLAAAAGSRAWQGIPAGTTMGHVHLSVGHLSKARDFFHGSLGFDVVVRSYPGALFLSAGGYHHHLGVNTWSAGARLATGDDARLLEWELLLPGHQDVERAGQSIESAGYEVTRKGRDRVVVDPWTTPLRLRPA